MNIQSDALFVAPITWVRRVRQQASAVRPRSGADDISLARLLTEHRAMHSGYGLTLVTDRYATSGSRSIRRPVRPQRLRELGAL